MWNKELTWFFEPGAPDGFNDPGISEFRSVKYDGLAREIIQNSLDAKDPNSTKPVKVVFEQQSYDMTYFPNYNKFLKTVDACIEYISDEKGNKSIKSLEEIKKVLYNAKNRNKFNIIKISDYNTLGLSGSNKTKGTPWANLVRRTGNSNKREGAGGSFGIGKYAPFVFSNIRSIIYSTKDIYGNVAVQGKSILSGHIYDSCERSPRGYFGKSSTKQIENKSYEDSAPITNANDIPIPFLREEIGTSLHILCARIEPNWFEEVRNSVINSFFWSIVTGKLEVEIINGENKIIITKETIEQTMQDCLNSDTKNKQVLLTNEYLKIFTNPNKCKRYVEKFDLSNGDKNIIGEMELILISEKNIISKSIAHIRETGMKIEDKSYNSLIGYVGIARTLNPEMNNFLRECEAPKHDEWSSNNYGNNELDTIYAKRILKDITNWERTIIKSLTTISDSQKLDPLGMEEFLPSDLNDEELGDNKDENKFSFKPLQTEITLKKNSKQTYSNSINNGLIVSNDGNESVETNEKTPKEEEGIHNKRKHQKENNGGEDIGGKQDHKGTIHEKVKLPIKFIKTPYLNEKGKYLISFIPETTKQNCYLKVRRAGDDILEEITNKKVFIIKDNLLKEVETFDIKENEKISFEVHFNDIDREALEVSCYAKK